MSKGAPVLVGWLGLMTGILVVVFSLAVRAGHFAPKEDNGHQPGLVFQLFASLLHAIDPGEIGNEALNGSGVHWAFLLLMLGITLSGLLIISALIGVIASGLEERFRDLRKGRSLVLERGHTLVLGWSSSVFAILGELAIANESEARSCVVVLADRDKAEIEDAIRERVNTRKTRVVVRRGVPTDPDDLAIVNPLDARAVIVTADEEGEPDAEVVKTLLALEHARRGNGGCPVVAVISDPDNLEAARLAGSNSTVFVEKRESVARFLVQASRQAGMSAVYTELLDFAGEEIYLREDDSLVGGSYSEALLAYENASVMGLLRDGLPTINPPSATRINPGDQIIAIAEDDSVLAVADRFSGSVDDGAIVEPVARREAPQQILVLGWNPGTADLLNELDAHVPPGSRAVLVSEFPAAHDDLHDRCSDLRNLELRVKDGHTSRRRTLVDLQVGECDHVIVLPYSDQCARERADAKTIMTLLHLRDLLANVADKPSIVSELLDEKNRKLAQVADVDDVIVSDRLISLLVSQLAQSPALDRVFRELFGAGGCEIFLRPAIDYVAIDRPVSFATLVEAARRRGETAIGYRAAAPHVPDEESRGVRLNPAKSEQLALAAGDSVVVLAAEKR